MRSERWVTVPLALLLVAACQPKAETPEQAQARIDAETSAVRAVIDTAGAAFATHFNAGHLDIVVQYYSDQGRVMAPNAPASVGKEAIKAGLTPMLAMKPELKLTPEMVAANGPLAVERGVYTISFTPPGAKAPVTESGKYLVHWHNVDGKWLKVDEIWNSDQPAMPMGPGQ